MAVNQTEYAWENITVTAMGRTFERITEVEYDVKKDKKYIRGRGSKVRGIQPGNEEPSGSITIGQSEMEAMIREAQASNPNAKLTDISFDLHVHYLSGTDIVKDKCIGCQFTDQKKSMKQGDSDMQVKLGFMCEDIKYNAA